MLEQEDEPDYYRYTLRLPLDRDPGASGVYCSIDPNLALGVLERATGKPIMDSFDRLLGGPLDIETYAWPLSPAGQPYGGGGVQFLPRDFMKLGQLMLNGGTWEGRRILTPEFVAHASAPLHDLNSIQYGLLWWSLEYPYKKRSVRAYFAGGNGGQGVFVIPELDLVIATYGGNYVDRARLHIQQEPIPNLSCPPSAKRATIPNSPVVAGRFRDALRQIMVAFAGAPQIGRLAAARPCDRRASWTGEQQVPDRTTTNGPGTSARIRSLVGRGRDHGRRNRRCSTAYFLASQGVSVALFEKGRMPASSPARQLGLGATTRPLTRRACRS